MENFDFNFLSQRIKLNKRKIYDNLNIIDSPEQSLDRVKKLKKIKEEKFIQLFDDSDSLEEFFPEISKKFEEEENKNLLLTSNIKIIGAEDNMILRKNQTKKRNISLVNIGVTNYKRKFFTEKENKSNEEINDKKTYSNRKKILLYDTKIIEEEEQNEDDDNNSQDNNNSCSKFLNNDINFNKIISEESQEISPNLKLKSSRSENFDTRGSKKRSKLLEEIKSLSQVIKVHIFESDLCININLYPSNNVKEIKAKIIHELKLKKYNLENSSPNAYDLRIIEEEGEPPDMDFPPLGDFVQVAGLKPHALAFLKNLDYNKKSNREKSFDQIWIFQKQKNLMFGSFPKRNSNFSVVIEEEDEDGPEKCEMKIYYKDLNDEKNTKSENISLNQEDSLKNILGYFFDKKILKIKNPNLYYFITHNNDEDLDNPYNLDMKVKNIPPPYELDLCYKIFPDLPQVLNTYHILAVKKNIEKKIKQLSN